MNYRWPISVALAALLFALALAAAPARATPSWLEGYLSHGKWHQEYGPFVTETVFKRDRTFTSITIKRGAPYKLYVEGNWYVRPGNQLWMEWTNWEPHTINKPLPEGTMVKVIDDNHFRNKLGLVTRVVW